MKIFLIGFMGAGKSSVGKKLAKQIGYAFSDTDRLIEKTTEHSIEEIFDEFGEDYFRELEMRTLRSLSDEDQVVATGGGAPCHHGNMRHMNASGISIYLDVPVETLVQRLMASSTKRPLIEGMSADELTQYVKLTLEERSQHYAAASKVVNAAHIDNAVKGILELLKG